MSHDEPSTVVHKVHHACVIIEHGGSRLLIDPGELVQPPDLDAIDAVLFTHGHYDHFAVTVLEDALARGIPVWAPADVVAGCVEHPLLREAVSGQSFVVNGVNVAVSGDRHADVHPEIAGPMNRAYLIADEVLVTGDAHPVVQGAFKTLVTPIDAPWLRAVDLLRYVRDIRPTRVLGIHDGLLNNAGLQVAASVAASLQTEGVAESKVLADGESVTLA
ncbi:MBL fold metallo-hydrolase [uncultured Agrococcus sp.]|uniref:MBL fold metallo-hydrolase n=1 Tax=uncultured Agrococcus sp. TaxID=382258 RepID=UPI0025DFA729|nr:MBL fold metallo-hydrolase [uncultured Agrococcus sp.]